MTPARWIATGGGVGLVRVAPGTLASLLAVLIGAGLSRVSPSVVLLAAVAATFGGFWAVTILNTGDDPSWIVIDEFAGQWITLLAVPRPTLIGMSAAFLLFRLLDISKLGPVGWADRHKSPAGVMGDDVIAGALGAAILWAVRTAYPGLLDIQAP